MYMYLYISIRRVLQKHRVEDRNERLHSKQPEYHPSLIVLCLFILLLLLIRCHCHKKRGLLIANKMADSVHVSL